MAHVIPPGPPRHRLGGYREYAPSGPLDRYVESVWTHRAPRELPPGAGAMHRVLPDPALSLTFACIRDAAGRPLDPTLAVIGPKTRPHIFAFRPGLELAAVRVKLEWCAPLLGLSPGDHADTERDIGTIDPGLLGRLLGPLAESRNADEAAGVLAMFVARRAGRLERQGMRPAALALDLVRRRAGRVSMDRVAEHLGVPPRTLHRSVSREAGMSLKRFARVTRLLAAVTLADRSAGPAWAAIAADSGFCDQSHLVRECRAIAGLAPGEVHRERRAQEAETSNPG